MRLVRKKIERVHSATCDPSCSTPGRSSAWADCSCEELRIDRPGGLQHDVFVTRTLLTGLILSCMMGCERLAPHVDPKAAVSPGPVYDPDVWEIGELQECVSPTAGFDRLQEQGVERGIVLFNDPDLAPKHCPGVDGGVVATDLDDDGDIDLLFHAPDRFPYLYENNGKGKFRPVDVELALDLPEDRRITAIAAHDLDGDRLPEVFLIGDGFLAMSTNLGDLDFSAPALIHVEHGYPYTCFNTVALGDVDGDNDLDIFLPGLDSVLDEDFIAESDDPIAGTNDLLFLQGTSGFSMPTAVDRPGGLNLSMFAVFTDRDMDGDKDLLVGTDRPNSLIPPMSFYRNDGLEAGIPVLIDDAVDISADLNVSAMGLGSADLNSDGLLDYCLSDNFARLRCLMSDGEGRYYDGGAALGLSPDLESHPDWEEGRHSVHHWTTWSVELQDLDNDGHRDLAVTAGPPADGNLLFDRLFTEVQPDTLFRGTADGLFVEDNGTAGFNSSTAHYGMAAADLDRDGALDLVVGTWAGSPTLWSNPCTPGAWLTIEPLGPPRNSEGLGVLVSVSVGDRTDIQELHGLRSMGQAPSELHFGLGAASTVDQVTVTWPDGIVQIMENAPTRRILYVRHPDAADLPLPSGARLDD
jgi:hypothetical protein